VVASSGPPGGIIAVAIVFAAYVIGFCLLVRGEWWEEKPRRKKNNKDT